MRLIDADELKKKSRCNAISENGRRSAMLKNWVVSELDINAAPTVEAEPLRHGKWEIKQCGWSDYDCICSVCGTSGTPDYKYCHECGAKMDGGDDKT